RRGRERHARDSRSSRGMIHNRSIVRLGLSLSLVFACAACDEDGLVGPVPGGPPGCDPEIDVDGGADASVFAEDHVVAAADLTRLADGSFAAAVERGDGTAWAVGVAFSDAMRAKLEWNLGPPPAGTTPPAANGRPDGSAS